MRELVGVSKQGYSTLQVHVQPRSAKNRCAGLHGDHLKIAVCAPPVDDKANRALCCYLAELFGVNPQSIDLAAGRTSRRKVFYFKTLTQEELLNRLSILVGESAEP
ncbi:MAG: DUF167 domain-containing protein [Desulfocapsaceae bacterium]